MTHENIPPALVIRATGKNGPTLLEPGPEPTLQQMLAAVDPKKHGGEVMDGGPAAVEEFAHGSA